MVAVVFTAAEAAVSTVVALMEVATMVVGLTAAIAAGCMEVMAEVAEVVSAASGGGGGPQL